MRREASTLGAHSGKVRRRALTFAWAGSWKFVMVASNLLDEARDLFARVRRARAAARRDRDTGCHERRLFRKR
jgi:hypothetical protein